ncbi:PPE domain-containing protein [Saccharopolyspora sp. NPDC000995]
MGLLSTLDNAGSRVFGWESAAEEERKKHGEEASRVAQQQQNQLAQQNSGLNVTSYDSPAITQCLNWSGFSHAQIYQTNQESIDQGKVGEVAEAWKKLAAGLRERGNNYATDLGKIVDGGWEGEAASNAREVGKPASDWMKASADAFEMTGNNLHAAGEAAGQASKMVEKPQGFSWGEAASASIPFGIAGGGINALSQMEEQEQAEKAAQETMARVYSPTLTQVDAKMPQYKGPDGNTKEPPPVPPPPPTEWGGGGPGDPRGGSGGGMPGGGTGKLPGGGIGTGVPVGGIPGSGIPDRGLPVGAFDPNNLGSGIPGGGYTTPSGTGSQWADQPGLPGGGGTGLSGGGAGGGLPGGGAGGAGMVGGMAGGLGAGAGGMAAGGRAGVGGLGAGAGAGAGAAGARGAGAGRGAMGGMGGAGQRGKGGEDEEHERPSWLEEQDDIWMNDMPKTAPPVLGE